MWITAQPPAAASSTRPGQHRPEAVPPARSSRPARRRRPGQAGRQPHRGRAYRGELAGGDAWEWAEPYAETARRRVLDAWTTIAGILAARDPAQALAALESALSHDPYNEYLYQKIMRLQAAAGHPEAVRRTLSLLEARLTELGITPGTQTRHVAAALLGTPGPPPPCRFRGSVSNSG